LASQKRRCQASAQEGDSVSFTFQTWTILTNKLWMDQKKGETTVVFIVGAKTNHSCLAK
jgi:hypothetical protein